MRVQRFFTLALLIGLALTAVLLINSSLAATSSAAGSSVGPDWVFQFLVQGSELGYSVGTAGDVNCDGYDDVIVGAPLYTDTVGNRVGAAFVFSGSLGGLSTTPALTITGGQKGSRFGASVGTAGDVNGDGCDDVIIGAPKQYGQSEEGRAYVFTGSILRPDHDHLLGRLRATRRMPGLAVGGHGRGRQRRWLRRRHRRRRGYSEPSDNEGAVFVYFGSASGLLTTAIGCPQAARPAPSLASRWARPGT